MREPIKRTRPKPPRYSVGILMFWVWGLGALTAQAQPGASDPLPKAAQLFDSARDLMRQGDFVGACKLLEESQRLDASDGTRLNLGVCNERQGKLASAVRHYQAVLLSAENQGHAERARFARERLEALRPKLSYLEVRGGQPAPRSLELDGAPFGVARIDQRVAVDPGEHQLSAVFPDGTRWTKQVQVGAEADLVVVRLPMRQAERVVATSSVAPAQPARPSPAPGADEPDTLIRDAGLVTLAIGGFSVVLAGFLGLHALDLRKQSDAECPGGACTQQGVELNDDARRNGNWATVFGVLGVAAVGTGVLMVTIFDDSSAPQVGAGWSEGAWTLGARGAF